MSQVLKSASRGLFAALALAFAVTVQPLAAQDTSDCLCVDRDGNEIENCSCFRAPDYSGIVSSFMPFSSVRPRLGVSVDIGQSMRHDARGARVTDLMEGGPAADAGIEEGDVITSVDGHSLLEALSGDMEADFDLDRSVPVQRLLAISRELEPGQEVEIEFLRDGEEHTVTVEAEELESWGNSFTIRSGEGGDYSVLLDRMRDLGDRMGTMHYRFDDDRLRDQMDGLRDRLQEDRRNVWTFEGREPHARLFGGENAPNVVLRGGDGFSSFVFSGGGVAGVEMLEMKPALAASFGVEAGVLITDVDEDSMLGLEAGDVLLRIGDREASTPNRARRILNSYQDDEEITLHVLRQGREMSIAGRLGS